MLDIFKVRLKIVELETEMTYIMQLSRSQNLKLQGVPERHNEDLVGAMKK